MAVREWSLNRSPTITTGELVMLLRQVEPTTQVTVDNKDWWLNIDHVTLPDNEELFTVILGTVDTFDSRQV